MNALAEIKDAEHIGAVTRRVISRSVINGIVDALEESVANQAALVQTLRHGLDSGLPAAGNIANVLLFHSQKSAGLATFLHRELSKETA